MKTIDLTPTWSGILPILLEQHLQFTEKYKKQPTRENRQLLDNLLLEIRNMARTADMGKEVIKNSFESTPLRVYAYRRNSDKAVLVIYAKDDKEATRKADKLLGKDTYYYLGYMEDPNSDHEFLLIYKI